MTHRTRIFQHISNDPVIDIVQGTRNDLKNKEVEGISDDLSSGVEKCLWNENAVFSYPVNTNSVCHIVSDSANDSSSGTGARTIKITGLQHSQSSSVHTFTELSQTLTMNGTTNVAVSTNFYRITKIEVLTAGSTGVNQGNIKIFNTGSSAIFGCMAAGDNHSNQLIVSPPTNEDIIVENLHVSAHFETPVELKINLYSQSTGLQKVLYKIFLSSNSNNMSFKLRKKLVAGDTLWASLNPLASVVGSHHRISALLECTQKHINSVIPS